MHMSVITKMILVVYLWTGGSCVLSRRGILAEGVGSTGVSLGAGTEVSHGASSVVNSTRNNPLACKTSSSVMISCMYLSSSALW